MILVIGKKNNLGKVFQLRCRVDLGLLCSLRLSIAQEQIEEVEEKISVSMSCIWSNMDWISTVIKFQLVPQDRAKHIEMMVVQIKGERLKK